MCIPCVMCIFKNQFLYIHMYPIFAIHFLIWTLFMHVYPVPAVHVSQRGFCVRICVLCLLLILPAWFLWVHIILMPLPWPWQGLYGISQNSICSEPSARPQTWVLHLHTCLILNLSRSRAATACANSSAQCYRRNHARQVLPSVR